MAKFTDEQLSALVARAFHVMHGSPAQDFLGELKAKMSFVKAYFDPLDQLPVTVTKLETDKAAQNAHGELHTGALSTIFDHMSSFSSVSDPSWWEIPDGGDLEDAHLSPHILERIQLEFGLSRSIKMHLQQPVKAGSTIYLVTKLLENTPRSTYFFSQIFSEDGILLSSGHHDKVKLTKTVKAKL